MTVTVTGYPSADTTTWTQWHDRCTVWLSDPHSADHRVAHHELGDAPERLPDIPGTWWVVGGRVFIAAKPGDRLDHAGERIAGIEILDPVEDAPGVIVRYDDRAIEVARRDGRTTVQVYTAPAPKVPA